MSGTSRRGFLNGNSPWSRRDLTRLTFLGTSGLALCAVGWFRASGETDLGSQVAPANLGLAGLMVAAAGHAAWLAAGRRAVGEKRSSLMDAAPVGVLAHAHLLVLESEGKLVAGAGLRRFHREECLLAAGRHWAEALRHEHLAAGRSACGVCGP